MKSDLEIVTCYKWVRRNPERRWLNTELWGTPSFREWNERHSAPETGGHFPVHWPSALAFQKGIGASPDLRHFLSVAVFHKMWLRESSASRQACLKYIFKAPPQA